MPSAHPRLRIAQLRAQVGDEWAQRLMAWLTTMDASMPPADCRRDLQRFLPEYSAR